MTLIQEQSYSSQRNWAFKASTSLSSHRFDNEDYEDPLGLNKSLARSLKALNLTLKAFDKVA